MTVFKGIRRERSKVGSFYSRGILGLLPANIFNLFFKRGFSEKCYSFSVRFLFHEEGSPLPAKIF
jgi:hypothetical protein